MENTFKTFVKLCVRRIAGLFAPDQIILPNAMRITFNEGMEALGRDKQASVSQAR